MRQFDNIWLYLTKNNNIKQYIRQILTICENTISNYILQYLTIYENLWQKLTLSDSIGKYLKIYQYLTTFDKNGNYSTKLKDNQWYWTISDNIGQYLSIFDQFWQYQTIFVNIGHYILISNNIITNLAISSRLCCFETFWILSKWVNELPIRVIEELSLLKISIQDGPRRNLPLRSKNPMAHG